MLALGVPALASAQTHDTLVTTTISGRLFVGYQGVTSPDAHAVIRVPALRAEGSTDSTGRFSLTLTARRGCYWFQISGLKYNVALTGSKSINLGRLTWHRSDFETNAPIPALGHCDPGSDQYDYNWVAAVAKVHGLVSESGGRPVAGQLLVVKCLGLAIKPPWFVADERPKTDSIGRYDALLRIRVDYLGKVTALDAVPCTFTAWREPFDSVRVILRFVAGVVPDPSTLVDLVIKPRGRP